MIDNAVHMFTNTRKAISKYLVRSQSRKSKDQQEQEKNDLFVHRVKNHNTIRY